MSKRNENGDRKSIIIPMQLMTATEEQVAELVQSKDWLAQEKVAGMHCLLRIKDNDVYITNKNGFQLPAPKHLEEYAHATHFNNCIIDGVLNNNWFCAFDLLKIEDVDIQPLSTIARFFQLEKLLENIDYSIVGLVNYHEGPSTKFLAELLSNTTEGIVLKENSKPYCNGKQSYALKHDFYTTANCVVLASNDNTISVGAVDGQKLVYLGDVTISSDQTIPSPMNLCEIRYLYRKPNGLLQDPTFSRIREDILKPDHINSLRIR